MNEKKGCYGNDNILDSGNGCDAEAGQRNSEELAPTRPGSTSSWGGGGGGGGGEGRERVRVFGI